MKGHMTIIVLAVMLAAVFAPRTEAVTWYVTTNGSDSVNSGTNGWGDAYATISNAVARAQANDTVLVSNGTYAVDATITLTNAITVAGIGGPQGTVVGRTSQVSTVYVRIFELRAGASGALLEGFTVNNGNLYVNNDGGAGVKVAAGMVSNCVIRNCRVTGGYQGPVGYGGGLYVTGGTVVSCVISNNTITDGYGGGGAYVAGSGQVLNSIIVNNSAPYGGGAYMAGGCLRNCRISKNTQGAGIWMTGGNVDNCTVADNAAGPPYSCSGLRMTGGAVTNTIVYFNAAGYLSVQKTGGSFSYSTAEDPVDGDGNSMADPGFIDRASQNYRLMPGSPCVDTGTNLAWMVAASDLDANARLVGSAADRGAYEAADPASGPLRAGCVASVNGVTGPTNVVLTASVVGANTNGLSFYWNLGDGTTVSGADKGTVTNAYNPGLYTITLTASNDTPVGATSVRTNFLLIRADTTYASPSGSNTRPYTNWATAAQSIQAAIDQAGRRVVISNGTYTLTQSLFLNRGLMVESLSGPTGTIVKAGNGLRALELPASASNAVVAGLTLTGGVVYVDAGGGGGGVQMAGGTVSNCVVRNSSVRRLSSQSTVSFGGGVWMSGGSMVGCVITNNSTPDYWSGQGGGVWMSGGSLLSCTLGNNSAVSAAEGSGGKQGGGVWMSGGLVANCIVAGNNARYGGNVYETGGTLRGSLLHHSQAGGGMEMTGGIVENCTICDNSYGDRTYAGLGMSGGGVTNTIVYFNQAGQPDVLKSGGSFSYSVSANSIAGTSNLTSDPSFKDRPSLDYSLAPGSLCRDSGTNLPWMPGAVDLTGTVRVLNGVVDRGAYEFDPNAGALIPDFVADQTLGDTSLTCVLTASVSGPTNGLVYYWNLGNGYNPVGWDQRVVTNTYGPGLYTVSLAVTNGAAVGATVAKVGYIRVRTTDAVYCSTNGLQIPPYTNWLTAATNIQAAIDQALTLVVVSNGIYGVRQQVFVDHGVTVRSLNGAPVTAVQRVSGAIGLFNLNPANAVLEGFTITGGNLGPGAGVMLIAGTVQNCIISNNSASSASGGGAYVSGGVLQNCLIVSNYSHNGTSPEGGGVFVGGTGKVRSCLICGNTAQNRGGGAAVASASAEIDACTIVGNLGNYRGGGIDFEWGSGIIRNTIIISNACGNAGWRELDTIGSVTYSCSPVLTSGEGNTTNDPAFMRRPGADYYRLVNGSPCMNTGTNQAWMTNAVDLEGYARILGGRVNMGAYEYVLPMGTGFIFR